MQAFLEQEERMLRNIADKVIKSGATVVFCQKGIDDLVQHFLSKAGIYAARRVKQSDIEKLSMATGAPILSSLDELNKNELGYAGLVYEQKVGNEDLTYIQDCRNPKAVTLLIRGGTEHVVDEVERAMTDALGDIKAAVKVGKVVAGAGAAEMEVSKELMAYASKLSGREQLAVEAFANAIEVIPRTLAENAGLDPIDMLTDLKAKHDKKEKWAGIDVFSGKVVDAWKANVIEPLKIKTQAVSSASEVAELILRIDDVIAAGSSKDMPRMPPGGMGGMPPDMM
jgi:chaperonin GroEL (HSP60 family)